MSPLRPSAAAARQLELRLLGGPRRLRRREVARLVGVSVLSARKLWRALGFANVTDEDLAFTDADAAALSRMVGLVRAGLVDEPTAIALARALGQTTERLVSWQVEALAEHLSQQPGAATPEVAVHHLGELADDLERLVVYAWRRQLAASVSRLGTEQDLDTAASSHLTVGFADLVSYTRLSQGLAQQELIRLVQRFEGLACDVVAAGGGRVVKTVGDEVLFTAEDPMAGAIIGLSLSEQMAVDSVLPDVRVGLAHGPVLRSLGDVFGSTVNLASRLTALAQPGTVVTDPATAARLAGDEDLVLVPQRRRQVRGFGTVQPLLIARTGPHAPLITLD
ncbi:MAG TPA: adenylate/guanylate cyclase domain-containing protein [Kineosporiaceae bacterium]|nr:adenylate/guanylate cyclase domain-containing protein [Kineosporiaceae bacterium]